MRRRPPLPRHRSRLRERAGISFAALPDYERLELMLARSIPREQFRIPVARRVLRIAVHDHIVVGRDGVASLKALGLM